MSVFNSLLIVLAGMFAVSLVLGCVFILHAKIRAYLESKGFEAKDAEDWAEIALSIPTIVAIATFLVYILTNH